MTKPFSFILTLFLFLMAATLTGCSQSDSENSTLWPMQSHCDLHTASCTASMDDVNVTLTINPQPIPIARPLGIEVTIENLAAQKVELDISGINMYMGYNRVSLQETAPGYFVGTSMLAFCTNQKMEWQLTLIMLLEDGSQIQVPYNLVTINR